MERFRKLRGDGWRRPEVMILVMAGAVPFGQTERKDRAVLFDETERRDSAVLDQTERPTARRDRAVMGQSSTLRLRCGQAVAGPERGQIAVDISAEERPI